VVDGQPARTLMQTTVETRGYRVSVVAGAEEGLSVAGTYPAAGVILELIMPQMHRFASRSSNRRGSRDAADGWVLFAYSRALARTSWRRAQLRPGGSAGSRAGEASQSRGRMRN
jgi:CheY-like chemotaxis protein